MTINGDALLSFSEAAELSRHNLLFHGVVDMWGVGRLRLQNGGVFETTSASTVNVYTPSGR